MNHRVSIVVSNTSTESGLGSPENCSNFEKPAAAASQNQSKRMCSLPFFLQLNHAQSSLAIRLSCFVIVFLSRVNAQQWSRATQGPSTPVRESGVFVHFFLLFFFFFFSCQLTIHSRALRLSVCCELQAADEKNLTLQRHVFSPSSQYPHGERMFEEGKSTKRIVHVVSPYTFRRPALRFRSFSIKPVESARFSSIGFSFSAFFFVSPLKQKWHKSVIRNDTKSVTSKPEHVRLFLLFDCRWSPTQCLSIEDFSSTYYVQDSSALSMLTKTYMFSPRLIEIPRSGYSHATT